MLKKNDDYVRVLDGSTFFVSDELGDAHGEDAQGLFFRDTRFLSVIRLTVNGEKPILLSANETDYYSACFFSTLPFDTVFDEHPLLIVRSRVIGGGTFEKISIANNADVAQSVDVELELDVDFADIFEVKFKRDTKMERNIQVHSHDSTLCFVYEQDDIKRGTHIKFLDDAQIDGRKVRFHAEIESNSTWETSFSIAPIWQSEEQLPRYEADQIKQARPHMDKSLDEWLATAPSLDTDWDSLKHAFETSRVDLAALRFYPESQDNPVLAAGLPWYMALFGRDNLITAFQCMYVETDLAVSILRTLANRQSAVDNPEHDAEPGKILHELRFGELTLSGRLPFHPYFGSVDSTPLFLIALHETYMWTGDLALVEELKDVALKCLKWIDHWGDQNGDGFVEYSRRSRQGINNHGWKDSDAAVSFADGSLATPPIALAEVQGYVYDAKRRMAHLCREVWNDQFLAQRLEREAARLRETFNDKFWIDSRGGYYAMARDGHDRLVDTVTSNMGHLLWSGIVPHDRAPQVVRQLFSKDMYSGWGVRTLSAAEKRFNPLGYHIGTVWPHDNSLIAYGLYKYGFRDEANRIAQDMLRAAAHFDHRLPEVIGGYARAQIDFPVEYPMASFPQAWASGVPPLLVRAVLGIEPDPLRRTLGSDPHLPADCRFIRLENIHVFGQVFMIDAGGEQNSARIA